MCNEIIIHQHMVTIATNKQSCTCNIQSSAKHITTAQHSKAHLINPPVFNTVFKEDIYNLIPSITLPMTVFLQQTCATCPRQVM